MTSTHQENLPGPLLTLGGFAAAAVFGFFAVPLTARAQMSELLASTQYRTWLVFVVLQATLWILGSGYAIGTWRRIPLRRFSSTVWLSAVAVGLLTLLPYALFEAYRPASDLAWENSRASPRGLIAVLFGLLASVLISAGIFRIHVLANEWSRGRLSPENPVATYRAVSAQLERHLLLQGAILAGAVIGTKAAREAFFSIDHRYLFPAEQIWQLAVYWSLLLAVVYWGSRSALRRVGGRLVEELIVDTVEEPHGKQHLDRERAVGESLGLHRSYLSELQSAFSVLVPIAGAVASQLI